MLAFGFYMLNVAATLAMDLMYLIEPSAIWHFAACLTIGGVWLLARNRSLTWPALRWTDAIGLVLTCTFFALIGAVLGLAHTDFAQDPVHALLISQLACMSTILARTVAMPSTPTRTFWLGVLALTPQMVFGTYILYTAELTLPLDAEGITGADLAFGNAVNLLSWSGVAVAISTVGSRVIFGLRTEADKVKRLGQYALEEKIGEGGMGIVYRASHAMLRRPTAIKLLPPEKTSEDSIRRRSSTQPSCGPRSRRAAGEPTTPPHQAPCRRWPST